MFDDYFDFDNLVRNTFSKIYRQILNKNIHSSDYNNRNHIQLCDDNDFRLWRGNPKQ